MSNILETIVVHKKKEVAERRNKIPVKELAASPSFTRKCFSLSNVLKNSKAPGIIAEFKRCSPSKGMINEQAKVEDVTTKYTQYGAAGLSVLTDNHFFKGTDEDLVKARSLNEIPILRKDFVVDLFQVLEAKSLGADVILLIAECLTKREIEDFTLIAKLLGMEVLLEMHSEPQLDKYVPDIKLVGINNRDLKTFKVDIQQSIKLAEKLPADVCKIAESGINDPAVVVQLKEAGFNGFLIGEYFMKQQDPGEAFRKFFREVQSLMSIV
jgi:indole-3-glycerol phosphate synthase